MLDLTGRRYVVTGVLNSESIGWHVAAELQNAGAEVLLTSFGRAARITRKAAAMLPKATEVLDLDVTDDAAFPALAEEISRRWPSLDGVLHSIAHAGQDAIGGTFTGTPADSAIAGFRVSAFSLQQLTIALAPLLSAGDGGYVVGLTVDAARALPGYDWMGVYKASLASITQYLAMYLGRSRIRVNLVAAGPLETFSARGVAGFTDIADYYERWAPLGWDRADPAQVVGAVTFLLSDLARSTTGQVVHADGGMHAVTGGIGVAPGLESPHD